jgi:hypothetical protein
MTECANTGVTLTRLNTEPRTTGQGGGAIVTSLGLLVKKKGQFKLPKDLQRERINARLV